jgi:replicative DNA helicase
MAALEYRILSKILAEKTLKDALKAGLSEDQFKDPESRQIWRYLRRHWYDRATAKTLPSLRAIQNRWPSFKMVSDTESDREAEDAPVKALIHDLKLKTFESDARALAAYFQELVDEEPQEAVRAMQAHLTDITRQFRQSQHLGVREIIENAKEHYETAQSGLVYGLHWPWPCLTEDTLGKRAGDFIVFYARMKQMKTWIMLHCATHDYLENNARVLIWSREMNKAKMCLRLASLMAKVDYQLFKKGKLPKPVLKRALLVFEQLMDEDFADYNDKDEEDNLIKRQMILLCGREAPKSMEEVQGFIQEYQPDIGYLDSFYHMETANMAGIRQRWHRFAVLSEDVKAMAEDECIPIVAVHQANRLGDKTFGNTMSDIADTDVLAREADLIIRVIKRPGKTLHEDEYEVVMEQEKLEAADRKAKRLSRPRIKVPKMLEEEERLKKLQEIDDEETPRMGAELALVLPGNREGVLNALTLYAVPGYNFELQGSDYSLAQIEEWIKENDAEDSLDVGAGKKKGKKDEKPKFNQDTFKKWNTERSKEPKPPKG